MNMIYNSGKFLKKEGSRIFIRIAISTHRKGLTGIATRNNVRVREPTDLPYIFQMKICLRKMARKRLLRFRYYVVGK